MSTTTMSTEQTGAGTATTTGPARTGPTTGTASGRHGSGPGDADPAAPGDRRQRG